MHSTDAGTGQHGDGQLEDHGHVDRDDVALVDPERLEDVGELGDVFLQLAVGHGELFAVVAFPDEGDARAVARLHVPINAVVCDVGLSTKEPLDFHRALGRVEVDVIQLSPHLLPMKFLRNLRPECFGILDRFAIHSVILFHPIHVSALHSLRRGKRLLRLGFRGINDLPNQRCDFSHKQRLLFINADNVLVGLAFAAGSRKENSLHSAECEVVRTPLHDNQLPFAE
mmetsp:Transcript_74064/g.197433  ORF Transcript_74064/g.197433 Transcript_74064/m.197433 type:complete len:227 (+) Transcript_74064:506-1186(+)